MKNKKSLNRLLTGLAALTSFVTLLYNLGMVIILSLEFMDIDLVAGTIILVFTAISAALVIMRMIMITIPMIKTKTDKITTIAALIMDVVALLGFIFVFWIYIGWCIPIEVWGTNEYKLTVLLSFVIIGPPFLFMGSILGGTFINAAIKTEK